MGADQRVAHGDFHGIAEVFLLVQRIHCFELELAHTASFIWVDAS